MEAGSKRLLVAVREKPVVWFYLLVTTIIFVYYVRNVQPPVWDASGYYGLASKIIENHLNFFRTDLATRTFFYPLFLAVVRMVSSWVLPENNLIIFFLVNLGLFHGANLLIYSAVKGYSKQAARVFLLLSSCNLIGLSFTVTLLTENLAIFFTGLIFYILVRGKVTVISSVTLGLAGSLFVFTRPSAALIWILVILYWGWKCMRERELKTLFGYGAACLVVFMAGFFQVYLSTGVAWFFSPGTSNLLSVQENGGNSVIKFETTTDESYPWFPTMYYLVPTLGSSGLGRAAQNVTVDLIHVFTIFDRVYTDVYVRNVSDINSFLRLANYFVLSGAVIYLLFLNKGKGTGEMVRAVCLLGFGTIALYVPLVIDPRYSVPVYPLVILLAALYVTRILDVSLRERGKWVSVQFGLIIFCFLFSNFTLLLLT